MDADEWTDDIDPATHCPFPKHRGYRWDVVVERDQKYAEWLISVDGPDSLPDAAYEAIEEALEER